MRKVAAKSKVFRVTGGLGARTGQSSLAEAHAFGVETATSLNDWTNFATVTNTGLQVEFEYPINTTESQRFFRLMRQGY